MTRTAHTPRAQIRDSWERIAPSFDRFATPLTAALGEQAIEQPEAFLEAVRPVLQP